MTHFFFQREDLESNIFFCDLTFGILIFLNFLVQLISDPKVQENHEHIEEYEPLREESERMRRVSVTRATEMEE